MEVSSPPPTSRDSLRGEGGSAEGREGDDLASMFPDLDATVLSSILASHHGNLELAINELLVLNASPHPSPSPSAPAGTTVRTHQSQEEQDALFALQYQRALRESDDGTVDLAQVEVALSAMAIDEQLALSLQATDWEGNSSERGDQTLVGEDSEEGPDFLDEIGDDIEKGLKALGEKSSQVAADFTDTVTGTWENLKAKFADPPPNRELKILSNLAEEAPNQGEDESQPFLG
eukprot:TRINITY_DN2237_c0_g1_i1.p1 TRINITY_DN2237_c0_g1~~TRINITY_DN2237_c0_g1_i1.p1  ORF type:complete len:252 (+),score=44.67 TRINITY_DN2237_c0_g1_i1:58-756(+)